MTICCHDHNPENHIGDQFCNIATCSKWLVRDLGTWYTQFANVRGQFMKQQNLKQDINLVLRFFWMINSENKVST